MSAPASGPAVERIRDFGHGNGKPAGSGKDFLISFRHFQFVEYVHPIRERNWEREIRIRGCRQGVPDRLSAVYFRPPQDGAHSFKSAQRAES
jgi:hypothetical protein